MTTAWLLRPGNCYGLMLFPPQQPDAKADNEHWYPDLEHLVAEHIPAAIGEEAAGPYGRYMDRPPGKEVAPRIERREERNSQAAVGHGVEYAVGGSNREEQEQHGPALTIVAPENGYHHSRHNGCK